MFRFLCTFTALFVCAPALSAQTPSVPIRTSESAVLKIGDILTVRVWPDSSLGGQFTIEETGLIYLPVIGEYRAADRAISAVRADLRSLYGKELKFPVINVTPLFRVSVLGAVNRPGLYYADPTRTWFDVISDAGGFRDNAERANIQILRDGQNLRINATEGALATSSALNVAVQSGDRIIVPEPRRSIVQPALSMLQTVLVIAAAIYQFSQ